MKNKLLVYNASAGSGKTHNLSKKFAEYLMEGGPEAYKHLMAVTFTNKATFEMKERIIETLYKKSIGKEINNPKEREKAKEVLRRLVHDYTMFRVSTIDSFFQKVLRAFALEMGHRGAFETSIDSETAVSSALDGLYSKLGNKGFEKMLERINNLSLARIDDDKNWDWKRDLLKISKQIVEEGYRSKRKEAEERLKEGEKLISYEEFNRQLNAKYRALEKEFLEPLFALNESLITACQPLDKSFLNGNTAKKFKSTLCGEKRFISSKSKLVTPLYGKDQILDIDRWNSEPEYFFRKNTPESVVNSYKESVGVILSKIEALYDKHYTHYLSYRLISENIRETILLDYVSDELVEYLKEQQLTLLADAPQILSDLISGSDTPFVYEKIGTTLEHYLLDEFQDTSDSQWENFSPLLSNSLASGKSSLLVGDIKQSIYRWRGGDWEILKDKIPALFKDYYEEEPLLVNFRSLSNIVKFNNLLFSEPGFLVHEIAEGLKEEVKGEAKIHLPAVITDIYKNSAQSVRDEYKDIPQKGVVKVIYPAKSKYTGYITNLSGFVCADIIYRIRELTEGENAKYSLSDIAILVNSNRQAETLASSLINNGISITSNDSLLLYLNNTVAVLLELLRKLVDPTDERLEALVRISSAKVKNLSLFTEESEEAEAFRAKLADCGTLYEMCEVLLNTFVESYPSSDEGFIKAFLDRVLEFNTTYGTNVTSFLRWWDEKRGKFFLPEHSSTVDAVKILTMHKAKGLAFKVVFAPFLREEVFRLKGSRWIISSSEWLGCNAPLMINVESKNFRESIYGKEADEELLQNCIDNLNLAYVSFTRARERLYIYCTKTDEKSLSSYLNKFCFNNSLFSKEEKVLTLKELCEVDRCADPEDDRLDFTYTEYTLGDPSESRPPKISDDSYSLYTVQEADGNHLTASLSSESQKAKLRSKYDNDDNVRRGILMHEIFSYIGEVSQQSDIKEVVEGAVEKFLKKNPTTLLGDDKTKIVETILSLLPDAAEYGWFTDKYSVENETEYLDGANIFRPDRVMYSKNGDETIVVDYKFGTLSSQNSYLRQVRGYMDILKRLQKENVKGYLWYVFEGKIIEV
ncbi:MAG: UvrD-helicase domain-containing protein [Bacteroidales bacterium]|nr:UvrD-helicase domain-containing protein [Bacteroidales bacterium]